ncbi:GPI biosynthesis protein Pig-F [Calycina marina]|uniref:GPI biosynthesis protein Pig-F n=1 Tax=Calycina marina TaxID=1763456 RepID=A0A9P8CKI9_9HELO|nr:GPI biosynthesis protein Pig-F [Calycina marina]
MPLIDPITMSSTAPSPIIKSSHPIELLPTDLARLFTHTHPAILLAAFTLSFPALVVNPVSTLLNSLPPLAIIQASYAVICLPATGTAAKLDKKPKPGAKKEIVPSRAPVTIFYALLLSLLSIPLLTTTQILFGAPLTTHLPHTLLSSAHIALLAIFPLVYVHGSDGKKWREVLSLYSPVDEVFGAAVGAMLGAWLGAVPIPLDWDREWQKWPVTIVAGVYAGYVAGKIVGGLVLRGKRIEFD